jgi:uncharacterized repeat protein (TIGR04138 family)
MKKLNLTEAIEQIVQEDSRYDREAYHFVREGLDFTVRLLKKENFKGRDRHVSGQQLLEGVRQYALQQFGPMAKTVLDYWGVRSCEDFGEIVFNLVEKGVLGKTEQDSRADFKGGYDFDEAFVKPFQPPRQTLRPSPPVSRHRSSKAKLSNPN